MIVVAICSILIMISETFPRNEVTVSNDKYQILLQSKCFQVRLLFLSFEEGVNSIIIKRMYIYIDIEKTGFNNTWRMNFQMFKLDLEKAKEQRSNRQQPLYHRKRKRVPEKHLLLLYWLCQSLWLCGSQQTVENSLSDRNTRVTYLPPEKSTYRSRSNS